MSYYYRSGVDGDIIYKIDDIGIIWSFCYRDGLGWMRSSQQGQERRDRIMKYAPLTEGDDVGAVMKYYMARQPGSIKLIRIHDNGYVEEKGYVDGTLDNPKEPWRENNWFVVSGYYLNMYKEVSEDDVVLEML